MATETLAWARAIVDNASDFAAITLDPAVRCAWSPGRRRTSHDKFVLHTQGIICSWNAGAERLFGLSPSDAVGRDYSMLFSADAFATGKPALTLQKAAASDRESGAVREDGWFIASSGAQFRATSTLTCLRSPEGELCGFGLVLRSVRVVQLICDSHFESDRWRRTQCVYRTKGFVCWSTACRTARFLCWMRRFGTE
jgi:PAS domain S-box-containing protein